MHGKPPDGKVELRTTATDVKRLNFIVSKDLHRALMIRARQEDTTATDIVVELIKNYLAQPPKYGA